MKIDTFNHIFPKPFFERLQAVAVNKGAIKRWLNIPFLYDVDVRFRMLEEFGDDYRQVLSLSAPPMESINPDRQITLDLATLANDSMADLVRLYPDRFPGFIASLPLNYPDESVAELERRSTSSARSACRCSRTSTACRSTTRGSCRCSRPPTGCAARYSCIPRAAPRSRTMPPRQSRSTKSGGRSAGRTRRAWRCSGSSSPASSTACPNIRIVAHHLGAMIPYFEGRVGYGLDQFGARTADEDYDGAAQVDAEASV